MIPINALPSHSDCIYTRTHATTAINHSAHNKTLKIEPSPLARRACREAEKKTMKNANTLITSSRSNSVPLKYDIRPEWKVIPYARQSSIRSFFFFFNSTDVPRDFFAASLSPKNFSQASYDVELSRKLICNSD